MHNKRYDDIISSMPAGLDRQVMRVLSQHVGRENAISRKELVRVLFNKSVTDLINSSEDRQIREAITQLQQHYMIISDMGTGGYYLCGSFEEGTEYIAGIVSRARELEKKARWLSDMVASEFGTAKQMGLF